MIRDEPVQYVEIDIDQCTLTWGNSPCTAALALNSPNKCYNSWNTCEDQDNYNKGTLTLRFIKPRPKMPIDGRTFYPTLKSVSAYSSTVNIVGFKQGLGSLGRRGTVTVTLDDFPHHGRGVDKYASERVSGAAQFDGVGYDPFQRSLFWIKLKQRNPNYASRPIRVVNTYIYLLDDGTPVWDNTRVETRNFVLTDIKYNYDTKVVTVEGKDVLTLAEKENAVAPSPSSGELAEDITAGASSLELSPSGIGDSEYPSSGYAVVGSEVVKYTRVGDTVTLTERGAEGTTAASHSAEDTFQQAIKFSGERLHEVIQTLLEETDIDPSFYDISAYQTEVERWASTIQVHTVLTEPTAVIEYLGELVTLGVSMWWDDVAQEIKMKLNHPLDFSEAVTEISDDSAIKSLTYEDKDEERITQVHFYSVQEDPTESVEDGSNYARVDVIFDGDAQNENNYGAVRIKSIFCRWLNQGNAAAVRILGRRYLQRFSKAPRYHTILLDAKEDVSLADVLEVTSDAIVDDQGAPVASKLQVISKTEQKQGHEIKYVAQNYSFDENYSFIMENSANVYGSATEAELERGCYIGDENLESFPDGRPFYKIM